MKALMQPFTGAWPTMTAWLRRKPPTGVNYGRSQVLAVSRRIRPDSAAFFREID
jgi:hypothetical protein